CRSGVSCARRPAPLAPETEELRDDLDPAMAVSGLRGVSELHGGSVQHLVHDALGQRLQSLAGRLVGAGEPAERARQLCLPDLLELLAEGDDSGHDLEAAQALAEFLHLAFHEGLGPPRLAPALAQGRLAP